MAQQNSLTLVDDLVADGKSHFTFDEARRRCGRSPTATANLLRRMKRSGLIDHVRHGHYAIRQLGVLGTRVAAEEIAMAVAAAFSAIPHRMAYRSALDEHDLITHPARSIQLAITRRVRAKSLSGRPLRLILEPAWKINVGAQTCGPSTVSSLERALLDAAARPRLVGGTAVLAEAITAAGQQIDLERLADLARQLSASAALRRIGSVADALEVSDVAGALQPLKAPRSDIDLEPGLQTPSVWRDTRWWVRWAQLPAELANVAKQ